MSVKLPQPPADYTPSYEAQRNRLIELFSNNVYEKGQDVGIYSPAKLIYEEYCGEFIKTDSQSPAAINTAYAITFTGTELSRGVSLGSPASRIVMANSGVYDFSISVQITSTNSSQKSIWMWLRKNGTNIPNSARVASVSLNNGYLVLGLDEIVSITENDYVEIMYAADDTGVSISSIAATAFAPAAPAAILVVSEADQQ